MESKDGFFLLGRFIKFPQPPPPPQGIWLFGNFIKKPEEKARVERLIIKVNGMIISPQFSRELWSLLGSMGVSAIHNRPKRIIIRTLTASNVNKKQARLTIPRKQLVKRFLKRREEKCLRQRDDKGNPKNIQVTVVDPMLTVRTLNLVRRNGPPRKYWSYALNSGWTDIVKSNRLTVGDTIQVWKFRKPDASLGFIIFKI